MSLLNYSKINFWQTYIVRKLIVINISIMVFVIEDTWENLLCVAKGYVLKRLCSDLKKWFHDRGFPENIVDNKLKCIKIKSREELVRPKERGNKTIAIPFIITYHPHLTLFHSGFLVPVFSWGGAKLLPCHKSSLANALIMKLGELVDQVKWGLLVCSLLP